jgi:N-acetylglutamate synthase-like GNAT family acetyltransferase
MSQEQEIEVRRATREDVPAIAALVREASRSPVEADEAVALDWLFGKGLLVAVREGVLLGVTAWQAENLVAVTDVFQVSPRYLPSEIGERLLGVVESEAETLMCEANVVVLPSWTPEALRTLLRRQGYELRRLDDLHRIWREVLAGFAGDERDLMVKRLRDRMVMVPL